MAFTSRLGTVDSTPGNVIFGLGGTVTNQSSSETITFTDVASETRKTSAAGTDSISFTETAAAGHTSSVSVTETLSFTETRFGATPLLGTVSNTLSFTESATKVHAYGVSVSETITFTDLARSPQVLTESAGPETLFFTDSALGARLFDGTAIDFLTLIENNHGDVNVSRGVETIIFSEDAEGDNPLTPKSKETVTLTELAESTLVAGNNTSEKLSFTEAATAQGKLLRQQFELLSFTESADRGPGAQNVSASDSVTLTDMAEGFIIRVTASSLTFTEATTSEVVKAVTERIGFTEVAAGVGRQVIRDTIFFVEATNVTISHTSTAVDLLSFSDSGQGTHLHTVSASDTITFTDEVVKSRYVRTNIESLTFFDQGSRTPSYLRPSKDQLTFTDTAVNNRIYRRSASDTITFAETKLSPAEGIFVGGVYGLKVTNTFTLITAAGTVILPRPEFGDSENTTNEFKLRYARTGLAYTVTRRRRLNRRLVFTFNLSRRKERELTEILSNGNDKFMTLLNWKGEQWRLRLLSNPVQSNNIGFDRWRVELEFEGIQLTSGGVNACLC